MFDFENLKIVSFLPRGLFHGLAATSSLGWTRIRFILLT